MAFCNQFGAVLEREIHSNRRKCGQGALWNGLMRHGACSRRWSSTLPKPRWKFGVTFGPRPTPEIEPTSTFQQKKHAQCMISSVYLWPNRLFSIFHARLYPNFMQISKRRKFFRYFCCTFPIVEPHDVSYFTMFYACLMFSILVQNSGNYLNNRQSLLGSKYAPIIDPAGAPK